MKTTNFASAFLRLAVLVLLFSCNQNERKSKSDNESQKLNSLFEDYWIGFNALNPLQATFYGIEEHNDKMEINFAQAYIQNAQLFNKKYLDALERVDLSNLTEPDRLNADLFSYFLNRDLAGLDLGLYEWSVYRPLSQFSLPIFFPSMGSGESYIPFRNVKDYENFLKRIEIFEEYVDVAIANMDIGIRNGNTNPQAIMRKVLPQIESIMEGDATVSLFYKPILNMPDSITTADSVRLAKGYKAAITQIIQPAYKKLYDYLADDYIPNARTSTGLVDNGGGKDEYRYWLKYFTTTDMTPEEIFDLGLREVTRIHAGIDSLKTATGFSGDTKAFFEFVRTDKQFFPFKTEEEILERFRGFEARITPHLDHYFGRVPKAAFEVRAVEKFRVATTNAHYMRPALDGSRPGIFYEAVNNPLEYNYMGMESLFLHEAIPGHHYQIALQQEMEFPEFRKAARIISFSEGWALYTEGLGRDLGLYQDPYQSLGRLSGDMERSIRLVVDVGMHDKGWTREEAIDYVMENQPISPKMAEQRIERYMAMPGQALSYKIGEQKILELKKLSQDKLGEEFSIREFHDEVLKDGALPLQVLEEKINRWIENKLEEL